MQMNISIRHGHVSDATQAMIQEKLEKLTRLYDRTSAIEITIDLEHRDQPAVDLKVSVKKHDFVAVGQAENLLAAVDVAVTKWSSNYGSTKKRFKTVIAAPGTGSDRAGGSGVAALAAHAGVWRRENTRMKFTDFICHDAILAQLTATDKEGAIREMVQALCTRGKLRPKSPRALSRRF